MGVTIHFRGQLKSEKEFNALMAFCTNYSEEYDLKYSLFKDKKNLLIRLKNGKILDEDFLAKGIIIAPGENCEPILMEFDEDLFFSSFCKTQFAGAEIHKQVISFLRKIEPFFENFEVNDEGEYWETSNEEVLKNKIDFLNKAIDEVAKAFEKPKDDNWKYN